MEDRKYPVGIQTFSEIREKNFKYVDKTEFIYELVTKGKYYFLSRPRRFGKSLLLSTIEAFYLGRRELFEGLYIADKEWDWVAYPVFHFALNSQDYDSVEKLDELLHYYLRLRERQYAVTPGNDNMSPSIRFAELIENVYEKTGRQVVILVDEYDQPLLHNIENRRQELQDKIRSRLQAFYSVLKTYDRYICFGMLTGVTKFSKVTVFSGLNNLKDISLAARYNAICGISESELAESFRPGIKNLAEALQLTEEETAALLKKEYDGYHFAETGEGIYNPFSLLSAFDNNRISRYWFATGNPSFLNKIIKEREWDLDSLNGSARSEQSLSGADVYLTDPVPLMYQSGYLTIKGYDARFKEYVLGFPNEEVTQGFAEGFLKYISDDDDPQSFIKTFTRCVERGDAEGFMSALQSFLADFPYDQIRDLELHWQNVMYLIMKLMGFYVHTEYKTSDGRIDMVVKTRDYIYVMEFKLKSTSKAAMQQIHDKQYALPFMADGRKIILIGAAFSAKTRRLKKWIIETL